MNTLQKEIEFGELFGAGSEEYSPPDIDMVEHWDVAIPLKVYRERVNELGGGKVTSDGRPFVVDIGNHDRDGVMSVTFDVKAQPKGLQSHSYRWVETQNVRGDRGWLYGTADFIAFEYGEYWVIVPRTALVHLVETKANPLAIENRDWVNNPQPFRIHTRADRKDKVMMVPVVDLCWIGQIIKKPD